MNAMMILFITGSINFGAGVRMGMSWWAEEKGSVRGLGAFFEKTITPGCLPIGASWEIQGWLDQDKYEDENETSMSIFSMFPNIGPRINIPLLPEIRGGIGPYLMVNSCEGCDLFDMGMGGKIHMKIKPILPLILRGEILYIKYITTDAPFNGKGGSRISLAINLGIEI